MQNTDHLEISFAHRTFAWGSDARGKAHVHVIIIGLAVSDRAPTVRRLFSYDDINGEPHESTHTAITPYLFDGGMLSNPHLVVRETGQPLNGLPKLRSGSQPIDDGNYIFTTEERDQFLSEEPASEKFFHPYIGSREYLNGGTRWILALQKATPTELRSLPKVVERMRAVKKFRAGSQRASTLAIANYPERYNVELIPEEPFLVLPEVSSQRREYIPLAWLEPPTIPSNLVRIIPGASKPLFAVLSSAMHMSWVRHIGGRLKSDYRYSIGLVYNTFPMPSMSHTQQNSLSALADAVLNARAKFPKSSLSDLYDPDLMPGDLRRAHEKLDKAIDKLYRRTGFQSDRERAEHLSGQYEKLISPIEALTTKKERGRRKKVTT